MGKQSGQIQMVILEFLLPTSPSKIPCNFNCAEKTQVSIEIRWECSPKIQALLQKFQQIVVYITHNHIYSFISSSQMFSFVVLPICNLCKKLNHLCNMIFPLINPNVALITKQKITLQYSFLEYNIIFLFCYIPI